MTVAQRFSQETVCVGAARRIAPPVHSDVMIK